MSWDAGGPGAGPPAGTAAAPQKYPNPPSLHASCVQRAHRHDASSRSGLCVVGGARPGGTYPHAAAARFLHLESWLLAFLS